MSAVFFEDDSNGDKHEDKYFHQHQQCYNVLVNMMTLFYVMLTLDLGIILFNDQLDAKFFFVYVYFNSLHVSSIQVLIIRRFNCINMVPGMCHLHRVACTRYRIDTIESPDDEHLNARYMQRIEINMYKKELYVKLVIRTSKPAYQTVTYIE